MNVAESANFLKERSQEVVNVEAQKGARAEERKMRVRKLLALRDRKKKEEEEAVATKKRPVRE